MSFRIDYTAGNIFDLNNRRFQVKHDHALVWSKEQAYQEVWAICSDTKANPEDFRITDLETGKKFRFRYKWR